MHAAKSYPIVGLGASLLALLGMGCGKSAEPDKPRPGPAELRGVHLSVALMEGPLAEAVEEVLGEWQGRTGAAVDVRRWPEPQLRSRLLGAEAADLSAGDIFIYPADWIGPAQERGRLRALPEWMRRDTAAVWDSVGPAPSDRSEDPAGFQWGDLFDVFRRRLLVWGPLPVAVPVSADAWLCYYRRDWLQAPEHREAFQARFGRPLAPPVTWTDYLAIAAYFHRPEAAVPVYGLVEPWGSPRARRLCWFAHVGPYAKQADHYSLLFDLADLRPRVADAAFGVATEEMRSAAQWGPPQMHGLDPGQAVELFLAGRAALCLAGADLPLQAARHPDLPAASAAQAGKTLGRKIGVSGLPGSRRVADTRARLVEQSAVNRVAVVGHSSLVASVAADAPHPEAAFRLLAFLSGPEISLQQVANVQTAWGAYRRRHLADPALWTAAGLDPDLAVAYLDALRATLSHPNVIVPLRLPEADAYLSELDATIGQILQGRAPAEALLRDLAERWERLTEKLGRQRQIAHLRRSLGLADLAP